MRTYEIRTAKSVPISRYDDLTGGIVEAQRLARDFPGIHIVEVVTVEPIVRTVWTPEVRRAA